IEEAEGQDEKTRQDISDLEKIIGPVEHWEQFLFQDASGRWHIKPEYQTPDPEDILNKMVGRLNDLTDKEESLTEISSSKAEMEDEKKEREEIKYDLYARVDVTVSWTDYFMWREKTAAIGAAEARARNAYLEDLKRVVSNASIYENARLGLAGLEEERQALETFISGIKVSEAFAVGDVLTDRLYRLQSRLIEVNRDIRKARIQVRRLEQQLASEMVSRGEFAYVSEDGTQRLKVDVTGLSHEEFGRFWAEYRKKHPALKELDALVEIAEAKYSATGFWRTLLIPELSAGVGLSVTSGVTASASATWTLYDSGRRDAANVLAFMEKGEFEAQRRSLDQTLMAGLAFDVRNLKEMQEAVDANTKALLAASDSMKRLIDSYEKGQVNEDAVRDAIEQWASIYAAWRARAIAYQREALVLTETLKALKVDLPQVTISPAGTMAGREQVRVTDALESLASFAATGSDILVSPQMTQLEGLESDPAFIAATDKLLEALKADGLPDPTRTIARKDWAIMMARLCNIHRIGSKELAVRHVDSMRSWLPFFLDKYRECQGDKDKMKQWFPDFLGSFIYPLTDNTTSGKVNDFSTGSYPALMPLLGVVDYIASLERARAAVWSARSGEDIHDEMLVHIGDIFTALSSGKDLSYMKWEQNLRETADRVGIVHNDEEIRQARAAVAPLVLEVMGRGYGVDSPVESRIPDVFYRFALGERMTAESVRKYVPLMQRTKGLAERYFTPAVGSPRFDQIFGHFSFMDEQRKSLEARRDAAMPGTSERAERERDLERFERRLVSEKSTMRDALLAQDLLKLFDVISESCPDPSKDFEGFVRAFNEKMDYLEREIMPRMTDDKGQVIEGYENPLFDAAYFATNRGSAYPGKDEAGRRVTYYVSKNKKTGKPEVAVAPGDGKFWTQLYEGTFDEASWSVVGRLAKRRESPVSRPVFNLDLDGAFKGGVPGLNEKLGAVDVDATMSREEKAGVKADLRRTETARFAAEMAAQFRAGLTEAPLFQAFPIRTRGEAQRTVEYTLSDDGKTAIRARYDYLDQDGKIVFSVAEDKVAGQVSLYGTDSKRPYAVFRGTFDAETGRVDGWLYQRWGEMRPVDSGFRFTLPDGRKIDPKATRMIPIQEFDNKGNKVGESRVFVVEEEGEYRTTFSVTQQLVEIPGLGRPLDETWVTIFDEKGRTVETQGWIAALSEDVLAEGVLLRERGFDAPILREKYNHTYNADGTRHMKGERYDILTGEKVYEKGLLEDADGRILRSETIDSSASSSYTERTVYERDPRTQVITEKVWRISAVDGKKEEKLSFEAEYIFSVVNGMENWDRRWLKDHVTKAWEKEESPITVRGSRLTVQTGVDAEGRSYRRVGGAIRYLRTPQGDIYLAVDESAQNVLTARYISRDEICEFDATASRTIGVTEKTIHEGGSLEIELGPSVIAKGAATPVREGSKTEIDKTGIADGTFTFPAGQMFRPDYSRTPRVFYKWHVERRYNRETRSIDVVREERIVMDEQERVLYKVVYDNVDGKTEVYELIPEATVEGRYYSNVMRTIVTDRAGVTILEKYDQIIFDETDRSKDFWRFLQSQEKVSERDKDDSEVVQLFDVFRRSSYASDGTKIDFEDKKSSDKLTSRESIRHVVTTVRKDIFGRVLEIDSTGTKERLDGTLRPFTPQTYTSRPVTRETKQLLNASGVPVADVYEEGGELKARFYRGPGMEKDTVVTVPPGTTWALQTRESATASEVSFSLYDAYGKTIFQEIMTAHFENGLIRKTLVFDPANSRMREVVCFRSKHNSPDSEESVTVEKDSVVLRFKHSEKDDRFLLTRETSKAKMYLTEYDYDIFRLFAGVKFGDKPLDSRAWALMADGTKGREYETVKFFYDPVYNERIIIFMNGRTDAQGRAVSNDAPLAPGQRVTSLLTFLDEDKEFESEEWDVTLRQTGDGNWYLDYSGGNIIARRSPIKGSDSYITYHLNRDPVTGLYSLKGAYRGRGIYEFYGIYGRRRVREFTELDTNKLKVDPVTGQIAAIKPEDIPAMETTLYAYDPVDAQMVYSVPLSGPDQERGVFFLNRQDPATRRGFLRARIMPVAGKQEKSDKIVMDEKRTEWKKKSAEISHLDPGVLRVSSIYSEGMEGETYRDTGKDVVYSMEDPGKTASVVIMYPVDEDGRIDKARGTRYYVREDVTGTKEANAEGVRRFDTRDVKSTSSMEGMSTTGGVELAA
ncbi:MAG: TolC family protein, partial [Candidatus Omnitrophica bacterium]|nr:TolC family protein [Candidatus Omnitrophota bacterium]